MDATDVLKESQWLWSRNNESIGYDNWIPSHHNTGPSANSLNCACYKPNNGFWKDCDCSLMQHFTCRKSPNGKALLDETPNMASFNQNPQPLTTTTTQATISADSTPNLMLDLVLTETTTVDTNKDEDEAMMSDELTTSSKKTNEKSNELMMDLVINEKQPQIITSSENDDKFFPIIVTNNNKNLSEKVRRLGDQVNARVKMLTTRPKIQLTSPITRRQPPLSLAENLMRVKLLKSDSSFSTFHCPYGFGYYLIKDTECTKYKQCEDWNSEYASMSVNKCREGMVFDFRKKLCVTSDKFECNESVMKMFVPEL